MQTESLKTMTSPSPSSTDSLTFPRERKASQALSPSLTGWWQVPSCADPWQLQWGRGFRGHVRLRRWHLIALLITWLIFFAFPPLCSSLNFGGRQSRWSISAPALRVIPSTVESQETLVIPVCYRRKLSRAKNVNVFVHFKAQCSILVLLLGWVELFKKCILYASPLSDMLFPHILAQSLTCFLHSDFSAMFFFGGGCKNNNHFLVICTTYCKKLSF